MGLPQQKTVKENHWEISKRNTNVQGKTFNPTSNQENKN